MVEVHGKVGEHKIKRKQLAVDLEDDNAGALPGLASRLRGLPINSSEVEVKFTLADDIAQKELAGRAVDLKVTIKEAREKKQPAIDDEMAKDTGEAETLDGLRDKIRQRLLETDEQRIKREMIQALVKHLVKVNEFPIAPALVERHAQAIVNRAKSQLMMAGIDIEGQNFDEAKMRQEFRADAEEEARGTILVQAIASARAWRPTPTCRSGWPRSRPRARKIRRSCARRWNRTIASSRSATRSSNRRRLIC